MGIVREKDYRYGEGRNNEKGQEGGTEWGAAVYSIAFQ